jgi:hypothetical protein
MEGTDMNVETFAWTAFGSIVAVIFPVLKGFISKAFTPTRAIGLPGWVVKYLALFVFGVVTAVIVLAIYQAQNPTVTSIPWYTAFLLGFGSESVIEKFTNTPA